MPSPRYAPPKDLSAYAWLSIATALGTIALKGIAAWLTGSVGLLSDAAESVVNLVAAVVALIVLKISIRPADDDHQFGYSKAEYFSAVIEGAMIFVAAAFIVISATERILSPVMPELLGVGLLISVVASALNGAVAWVLYRRGRQERSLTLIADGLSSGPLRRKGKSRLSGYCRALSKNPSGRKCESGRNLPGGGPWRKGRKGRIPPLLLQ